MTALKVPCDIRRYEKSTHLFVFSSAKKIHFTGIQTDLSSRLFFTMRYYDKNKVLNIMDSAILIAEQKWIRKQKQSSVKGK